MTKHIFLDETHKDSQRVVEQMPVLNEIDKTMNILGIEPGSAKEKALISLARFSASVMRAQLLGRPVNLLTPGSEALKAAYDDMPWLQWDPVVIFINKPDHTIEACESAIATLNLFKEHFDDDAPEQKQIDYEISVQKKFIDTIKVQI